MVGQVPFSLFPVFALIVISLATRITYDEVMPTPLFRSPAACVVVLLSLNLIVMRKLTDIKV